MENKKHSISLTERSQLEINGVIEVNSFDENEISLSTSSGILQVSGEQLNVSGLNLENGTVSVTGKILALEYLPDTPVSGKGLFSRLFSSGK